MQRLLYHAPDNPNQESPFDRAIVQVVQGQNVSIVSPYIGLEYLHRLIGLSASWRLISDVLEWLSATPVRERGAVYEFLKTHYGLVHHYPAIHAKAVVSRVGAYTGSANLTDAGVLRRTEFGVLLTDPCQVSEVQQWFDDIWVQTSPPPLQSVQELIAELNQISHVAADFADLKATQLESGARRVRAKLVKILGHEPVAISARGAQSLSSGSLAPAPATSAADKTAVTVLQTPSTEPSKKTQLISPPPSSSIATPTPLQPSSFDLDAEIEAYVGRNAVQGFTFEQLHETMRSKSPALTRRETYFAILESCASHPRALFSADAVNRLVYQDGRFVQSSKELLSAALKPLDDMVAAFIDDLSFDEPTATSVTTGKQEMVLAGMKQAGFVEEVGDGLQLAHDALWSPRLKLLERAHIRWANRLAQRSFKRAPGPMLEGASLGLSHLAETSVQAPVVEPAVESMAEGTDSQEVVNESRDHKKDIVFSHLAKMRHSMGEKINVLMYSLITDLVGFVAQVGRQTRLPQPQTQLCHGTHGHRARAPELRETVEQSHTHMQLHHLPLKRARHHPLAQAFEAVHLGLHQTSAVIAAPLFPDAAPQSVTGSQRFVARMRSHQGRLPRLGVLARGDHRLRISLGNRRMARLGVVGTVPTDAGNRLIGWYLLQQLEQHGRIAHAVVGHLDGPDLQRVGINTQVHLAPLAPVLGTVLLAFPFAFAKELNAGAVHQQFQCGGTGSVGQLYLQSLLASAHGAVVGHPPVQACQTQQAFNHAQALTQGQTEQALDAQTELDGCVGEDVLAPAFAAGWGVPLHAFVQPDCQRPSGFERGVVLCPVGGLVAGLGPLRFTHVSRLPAQRTGFVQQSRPSDQIRSQRG